jgi:hypothetical protein
MTEQNNKTSTDTAEELTPESTTCDSSSSELNNSILSEKLNSSSTKSYVGERQRVYITEAEHLELTRHIAGLANLMLIVFSSNLGKDFRSVVLDAGLKKTEEMVMKVFNAKVLPNEAEKAPSNEKIS